MTVSRIFAGQPPPHRDAIDERTLTDAEAQGDWAFPRGDEGNEVRSRAKTRRGRADSTQSCGGAGAKGKKRLTLNV